MFTAAVVVILALGIGSTTAVFSVVHGLLLSPLPYPEADRIVRISKNDTQRGWSHYPVLLRELETWREASESLESLAALRYTGSVKEAITIDGTHHTIRRVAVTANYFDVLGVSALMGRTFEPSDELNEDAPSVVVSHRIWRTLFAADPGVVGRAYPLAGGDRSYRVVGVLPPGVAYPEDADVYAANLLAKKMNGDPYIEADVVARLATGASREEARSELQTMAARLAQEDSRRYPEMEIVATPLMETVVGDVRRALWLLFGAVGVVLLIAAANVASLLYVRGAERDRELAIRVAMGAGRGRLVRQLFVETLLLAAAGGALGVVLARWGLAALLRLLPDALPRAGTIALDVNVLAFALGATVLAAVFAGLLPAWKASGQDALTTLRRGRGVFAGWRAMNSLVVFELSLAFVLVVSAALLAQAFLAQLRIDRGFTPEQLTYVTLQVPEGEYPPFGDVTPRIALMDRLIERAGAVPGVTAVTVAQNPPGSGDAGVTGPMAVEGQTDEDRERNPMVSISFVPESYFETLGMTLLRGRGFRATDRGNDVRVAVVTESFAEHHWPGEDAIGKRIGSPTMPFVDVVGVVADVRYRELRKSWLDVYFPAGQTFGADANRGYYGGGALIVRSTVPTEGLASALRAVVTEVDADLHVESIVPLGTMLDVEVARPRFQAAMLGLFAGTGLLLAAVGLYAVMATVTGAREREIGVRLALGSSPREAVATIWKRGALLSGVGVAVGLVAAVATTRLLSSLLFGVSPLDPRTLAGAAVFLGAIMLVAAYVPARRAANVDPSVTLRQG